VDQPLLTPKKKKKHSFMIDGTGKLLSCAVQNLWCKLSNVVVYGIAVYFSLFLKKKNKYIKIIFFIFLNYFNINIPKQFKNI
jgi:hypothetical protein